MSIDITTIIISIIGLALFFIPVILDWLSKKKNKKTIEQQFLDLAKNKNVKITYHETWRNSKAIGINSGSRKLFYLKKQEGNDQEILIDLAEVKECRIDKKSKMNTTDQINLVFTFKNSGNPEKLLTFYRKDQDQALQDEIDLAEKWVGIINLKLS
jgi:hypothetical protein